MEEEASQFIEEAQQCEKDEIELLCLEVELLQIMKDFFENQAKLFNQLIYNQEVKDLECLKEEQELADKLKERKKEKKELNKMLRTSNQQQDLLIKTYDHFKDSNKRNSKRILIDMVAENIQSSTKTNDNEAFIRRDGFYRCSECPFKTKWHQRDLKRHINVVHRKLLSWKCSDCVKAFGSKQTLIRHQQQIHSTKKDWTCDCCGSRYAIKNGLRKHMNTHLPPSFVCTKCDKKFVYASNLKVHLKFHEGILNEVCKHCNKGFTSKGLLSIHIIRKHFSELHCGIPGCSSSFSYKSDYKNHLKKVHNKLDKILIGKLLKKLEKLKPDYKLMKFVQID